MTPVIQAKEDVKRLLRGNPALKGVGITWNRQGEPCVLVNVEIGANEAVRARIRKNLPNVEFVIQEVGPIATE